MATLDDALASLQVRDFVPETLVRDFVDESTGVRILVRRGRFSFCAYLGVHRSHVLAELPELEFPAHWGINFREWGAAGSPWAEDWFWWGWDYGHAGDIIDRDAIFPPEEELPPELRRLLADLERSSRASLLPPAKDWTVGEIVQQALFLAQFVHEQVLKSELLSKQVSASSKPQA